MFWIHLRYYPSNINNNVWLFYNSIETGVSHQWSPRANLTWSVGNTSIVKSVGKIQTTWLQWEQSWGQITLLCKIPTHFQFFRNLNQVIFIEVSPDCHMGLIHGCKEGTVVHSVIFKTKTCTKPSQKLFWTDLVYWESAGGQQESLTSNSQSQLHLCADHSTHSASGIIQFSVQLVTSGKSVNLYPTSRHHTAHPIKPSSKHLRQMFTSRKIL